jgi:hypothetical protein
MMEPKRKALMSDLTEAELNEASDNLVTCLEGLERNGEEGLHDALDKIYGRESRPRDDD